MGETAAALGLGATAAEAGTAGSLLGGALAGTEGLTAVGAAPGLLASLGGGLLTGAGLGSLAESLGLPASTSGLAGGLSGLVGTGMRSAALEALGSGNAGVPLGGLISNSLNGGLNSVAPTLADNAIWKMAEPSAALGSAADALAPTANPTATDPMGKSPTAYGKQIAKSLFEQMMKNGAAELTRPEERQRSGSIAPLPLPTLPSLTFTPPQFRSWAQPMSVTDLYRRR